jgi:hypothetical protein
MTARSALDVQQQAVDVLFAQLGGNGPTSAEPPADVGRASSAVGASLAESDPAPTIRGPEDLKSAAEWVQREKERLAAYTRAQIQRLQADHQVLISQSYLNEQTLILRSQELSRKEEWLVAQGRALKEQAEELSRREQSLAAQLNQWGGVRQEMASVKETTRSVEQDTAAEVALLDALRSETEALHHSREVARTEFEALMKAIQEQGETRAREDAIRRASQDQFEQRRLAADRQETAMRQRLAELDDLETRLRREFEEQERQIRAQRQELAAREARLLSRPAEELASLAAREVQLEQRAQELQHRERDLEDREQYLEQWQFVLEQWEADSASSAGAQGSAPVAGRLGS